MSNPVIRNRKAYHDYEIIEKFEAGISLLGSEVKAIRNGRVNLKDSFVKVEGMKITWIQGHISVLSTTNAHFRHEETRPRQLLLHKKEINKLINATTQKGFTIVPLTLYFNSKNIAKLQIAIAKGKQLHDKRQDLKNKQLAREAAAAMKRF